MSDALPVKVLRRSKIGFNDMSLPQSAPTRNPYTILPDHILDNPQALELSGNAYAMLVDFWRAWQRATRNGRRRVMSIAWTSSDYPRKISRPTFDKARAELEEAGFIHAVRRQWGRWAWAKLEKPPCKETLHPIRHYKDKTSIAESFPKTRVSKERPRRVQEPTTRHGPPKSLADILRIGDFHELDLALQISRITGEPHWRAWWQRLLERMAAADCAAEFEGWVSYAADCGNPQTRKLKDLGPLKNPGAFLVSKALALQHRHGFAWDDYPQ